MNFSKVLPAGGSIRIFGISRFPFVLEAKQLVFSTLSLILKTLEQLESLDQIASLYILNNY